jgi:hypothetical protein
MADSLHKSDTKTLVQLLCQDSNCFQQGGCQDSQKKNIVVVYCD